MKSLSRLKKLSIKHWKNNIKKIEKMDFDKWNKYSEGTRRKLLSGGINRYPKIFSNHCPFCKEYRYHCTDSKNNPCPLTYTSICILEWSMVHSALMYNKVANKTHILDWCNKLIKGLESLGE